MSQSEYSIFSENKNKAAFQSSAEYIIPPETAEKAVRHADICRTLNEIFVEKNLDYGDSFNETFKKLGIISAVTRISDKTSRLQSLCKREALVKDETLRDTLMDLANYSILTILAMDDASRALTQPVMDKTSNTLTTGGGINDR